MNRAEEKFIFNRNDLIGEYTIVPKVANMYELTIGNFFFNPKDDITPLESVRIAQIFAGISICSPEYLISLIEKYASRHFDDIPKK